jgi:peptidoglycan hydrolase-like amidase
MQEGEPTIRVGVVTGRREIGGRFNGIFTGPGGMIMSGDFCVHTLGPGMLALRTDAGDRSLAAGEICCRPQGAATFSLAEVTIGVNFHWQRQESQTFQGALSVVTAADGSLTAINEISLEDYLRSVIASEMSATSPPEFLKAHAVMSRSWLMAMLAKKDEHAPAVPPEPQRGEEEICRWYGREEHDLFDVCADDHCQRYQGVTKIISEEVRRAVEATRGMALVYGGRVCDARYHKACGGRTEDFANVWEGTPIPYLTSIADGGEDFPPVTTEEAAARFIQDAPYAYCKTVDIAALGRVLPAFDQETPDFFRWEVSYARPELESLLLRKSGIDFGELCSLTPLERGMSGRIIRLKISGSKRTVIVGKELEIRRWLSPSHLYSSAFVVRTEEDGHGKTSRFTFHGAGWGHGVGLCQIGAAMMALRGFGMEAILGHYFPGTTLRKQY